MVKKQQKTSTSAAGLFDNQLAQSVRDSAQQIWLAGMGAFAKAQQEGGKVFETLVKEGMDLQRRTQTLAEARMGAVASKVSAMADGVTAKAGQQWDKLESIFEQRVSKAMGRLGVPSREELDELAARIDALAKQVAQLSKPPRAGAKAASKRSSTQPATTKPTAKRAAKSITQPPAPRSARKRRVG